MKLREAIGVVNAGASRTGKPFQIFLATGFEPLHLKTFLAACAYTAIDERPVTVNGGLFGDLVGNIARISDSEAAAAAVVMEWSDLDPRLGLRRLGGWGPRITSDIVQSAERQLGEIVSAIRSIQRINVAVAMPTLPLPPAFHSRREHASAAELDLMRIKADAAAILARLPRVRVVSDKHLDLVSPHRERADVASEIATGFPYALEHASHVAQAIVELIVQRTPRKGLITDLDDTIWRGLLGEDGLDGVSWDFDNQSHVHALYQQTLNAIAESGALIGIATRNDASLVNEALRREDLVLQAGSVFPISASWGPKSDSVAQILASWNIGAGDVVFVDDNPLELAEVQAAFPGIECLLFEPRNPNSAYQLLRHLRHSFGKPELTEEDAIRASSIRASASLPSTVDPASRNDLMRSLEAVMRLDGEYDERDARPLELINKTNQFNLNGRRLTASELLSASRAQGALFLLVSYRDKFGPLGKVSVLLGRMDGGVAKISSWVMSCRAFGRRIEHAVLHHLFETTGAQAIELDYQPTARNTPMREFLDSLGAETDQSVAVVERGSFARLAPPLFFEMEE